jgi:hypothetical protein
MAQGLSNRAAKVHVTLSIVYTENFCYTISHYRYILNQESLLLLVHYIDGPNN